MMRTRPSPRPEPSTLLRRLGGLAALAAALLASAVALGQESAGPRLWVGDELRITLRSGPGEGYRVLRTLVNGTAVTQLSVKGEWIQVALEDGTRGFVLGRYLTDEVPATERLQALLAQRSQAESRAQELEAKLRTAQRERDEIAGQIEEIETLRTRNETLEQLNEQLRGSRGIEQMVVGAGIALFGVVLGSLWGRGVGGRSLGSRRRIRL